jgi:hypothetical protein
MIVADPRISAADLAKMSPQEIGKHMSGGYGPAKFLAMATAIRDAAIQASYSPNTGLTLMGHAE